LIENNFNVNIYTAEKYEKSAIGGLTLFDTYLGDLLGNIALLRIPTQLYHLKKFEPIEKIDNADY